MKNEYCLNNIIRTANNTNLNMKSVGNVMLWFKVNEESNVQKQERLCIIYMVP